MTHVAHDEALADIEVPRQMVDSDTDSDTDSDADSDTDSENARTPAPVVALQPTGDDAVDHVLARLDAVADEPLDEQIEAGEQVHRVLQGRLAALGKE